MWTEFECKNLGDYHGLYLRIYFGLLADAFVNFISFCLRQYKLDPAHYYTSLGLSWDALLTRAGEVFELLTDVDMHLFIREETRGWILMVSKCFATANNPYAKNYDTTLPKS